MSWKKIAFGIRVDPNMLLVHARRLAPPSINYHKKRSSTPNLADWNLIGKNFFEAKQITHWSFLNLTREQFSRQSLTDFKDALKDCGMGREIPDPVDGGFKAQLPGVGDDDQSDDSIREMIERISHREVRIVLVILPVKSAPLYARVKYWADIRFGMI